MFLGREPQIQGLDTILDKNNRDEGRLKNEEIKKIKRHLELEESIRQTKAAIKIQKIFRGHIEKKYLLRLLENKYCKDMEAPSVRLQAIFRQVREQKQTKEAYLVFKLRQKVTKAIIKFQAIVRSHQTQIRIKREYFLQRIIKLRSENASIIQKNYKSYLTQKLYRKVLEFERNFISICWHKDSQFIRSVSVVGSFTSPPWTKKVELDYCPLRGIFVKYMSNLEEGSYLIKFIVDGKYMCNPNYQSITDQYGNENNLIKIDYDQSEQQSSGVRTFRRTLEDSISSSLYNGLMKGKVGFAKSHNESFSSQKQLNRLHGRFQKSAYRLNQMERQSAHTSKKSDYVEHIYQIEDFNDPQSKILSDNEEEKKQIKKDFAGRAAPSLRTFKPTVQKETTYRDLDDETFENPSFQQDEFINQAQSNHSRKKSLQVKKQEEQKIAVKYLTHRNNPFQEFYEEEPLDITNYDYQQLSYANGQQLGSQYQQQYDDFYAIHYYGEDKYSQNESDSTSSLIQNPITNFYNANNTTQTMTYPPTDRVRDDSETAQDTNSQNRHDTISYISTKKEIIF